MNPGFTRTGPVPGRRQRRVPLYRLVPACLLLLLGGCGPGIVTLSPLAPGSTVLAFGDSLTAGYGAGPRQSYPDRLAELAVLEVINGGVSGELSAAGLARLPGLLSRHRPSLMILCHGGNDMLRDTGNAAAMDNLLTMIGLARAQGVEVLLLGVPEPRLFFDTAGFYDDIAAQTGVAYIPDLVVDVLTEPALRSDAVHPNADGYLRMAQGIQQYLIQAGAL